MSRVSAGFEPACAYTVLAALEPDLPAAQALAALLRQLAAVTQARAARLWHARDGAFVPVLTWPPEAGTQVARSVVLEDQPDVDAIELIHDGAGARGAVTLTGPATRQVSADDVDRLRESADCVLLIWRRDELQATLHRQLRHTDRLGNELGAAAGRLSTVRDLERRRVATEIITLSTGRLARLHAEVGRLGRQLAAGRLPDGSHATALRALLDELIEDFRLMVRGIHPEVLRSRGPRAALGDVAAGLARPARITGAVPARVDPELAAALYHFSSAALQMLATTAGDGELQAHLSQTDALLGVLITGRARISTAALRAALTVDTDRLAALGGGTEIEVEDDVASLRMWLPDRLEPAALAPRELPSSLAARVRTLAQGLAAGYGEGPGSATAQALVARLDGLVRVGVVPGTATGQRADWLQAVGRRLPDLVLSPLSVDNPDDPPDVVLQPAGADPDRRVDLVLTGAGMLARSAPWLSLPDLLTTEVLARADLLRARSVLAGLSALHRAVPLAGALADRFGYELEELLTGAHELVELDALSQLRTGRLTLTRGQLRTAERLLGGAGPAPQLRLGLPADAGREQIRRAAGEQLQPWRRLAENATAGRRQRQACAVIVRSCEAMLARSE